MAGIFDPAKQGVMRAPVDEFFAGRNSAMIDDDEWDKAVWQAERILGRERGGRNFKEGVGNALAGYMMTGTVPIKLGKNRNLDAAEGSDDDKGIRSAVQEKTGLFMYPGQSIKTDPADVAFMREFDDSGASLVEGWRDGDSLPKTLGGLLQHEELYKHYPELADMPLEFDEDPQFYGSYGGVSEQNPIGVMGANINQPQDEMLRTLLHESQHYIQDLEGWPSGGSPGNHAMRNFASWHPDVAENIDRVYDGLSPAGQAEMAEDVEGMTYGNIAGEILARDVEDRFDKRRELEGKKDTLLNPDNPSYYPDRSEESKNHLLGRLNKQSEQIDRTYPYIKRDDWSNLPHEMPVYEDAMPLLMTAAMAQRSDDKYAEGSKKYAESLLDEILKQRK